MKVITLIENTRLNGRRDLTAEHGLSLHVEFGEHQLLFDMGATGAFNENAKRLGVDLRRIDTAVISHHHFDHGGGLGEFLQINNIAKVYVRGKTVRNHYFKAFGILKRSIGLDRRLFRAFPHRFEFVEETQQILPDVFILTDTSECFPLPKGNSRLSIQCGSGEELDRFDHELSLVVREEDELTVFTGCSHRGILNLVDATCSRFPGVPIKAAFGGFHLIGLPMLNTMAASKREVRQIGQELLKYPVEKFYTGHCTGPKAYRILKEIMGERLESLATGCEVTV